jgi:pimeloyl-ACP methyl ester carboxylesterase
VILCQTIGKEYINSHRAFFQLAVRLAAKGYTTLRFDYFGCGDSEGDFEAGSMAHWVEDVQLAVEEMKIRTGANIILVGYRLGASLALKTAIQLPGMNNLVLWEIIGNGEDYLNELNTMQLEQDKTLKRRTVNCLDNIHMPAEFLGFPFEPHLLRELKALRLSDSDLPAGCKSLTLFNRQTQQSELECIDHSVDSGFHSVQYIDDHQLWKNQLYKRLIPVATLDAIVSWIERVSP